jgi:hypothetical protein
VKPLVIVSVLLFAVFAALAFVARRQRWPEPVRYVLLTVLIALGVFIAVLPVLAPDLRKADRRSTETEASEAVRQSAAECRREAPGGDCDALRLCVGTRLARAGLRDAWGGHVEIEPSAPADATSVVARSAGPDGQRGSEDDVVVREPCKAAF